MPGYSVWFVRMALTSLVVGVTFGAVALALPGTAGGVLVAAHIELLFFGWFMHLGFGVAAWMFPKVGRDEPRGSARLAWTAFALCATGTLLATCGALLAVSAPVVVGRVAQLAGAGSFMFYIHPRVRAFGA